MKPTTKAAMLLALASLINMGVAHADGHTFTPIEKLPPEQRQMLIELANELTKTLNIDWDEIVIGVDENGKPTLMTKSKAGLSEMSSPSSFGMSNDKECK